MANSLDRISSVTLVLTSGCNLTCSYCYQNAKLGRRMSWDTLRRGVDTLLASREDEVELAFYGGEPLTRFDMIRRAVDHVERSRRPTQTIDYSIITNGTLMGEPQREFLAGHDFKVQLSMDGTPAVQSLRGAGTFAALDALLERLRREHPRWFRRRLSVTATVLPGTVHHLADSVAYFLDKGVARIGFSPDSTDTTEWRLEQIHELEAQFERIFEISRRRYRSTGQIPVECLRPAKQPRELPRPHAMCNVERAEELTVDVDGEVHGCAMFAESYQRFPRFLQPRMSRLRLGAITRPGLSERVRSYPEAVAAAEIFHRHDAKRSGYGECQSCEFLEQCFVCPVSIGQIPGNADPHRIPDFLCAFSLVSNRYRQRLASEQGLFEWMRSVSRRRRSVRHDGARPAGPEARRPQEPMRVR